MNNSQHLLAALGVVGHDASVICELELAYHLGRRGEAVAQMVAVVLQCANYTIEDGCGKGIMLEDTNTHPYGDSGPGGGLNRSPQVGIQLLDTGY